MQHSSQLILDTSRTCRAITAVGLDQTAANACVAQKGGLLPATVTGQRGLLFATYRL